MGVISLVSVYAPTDASDLTVKDAFYSTLESVVDQYPRRDTLLVLGDFNASTGTDRDGYETCVGPHGSGTVNLNSTKFLDFARSLGALGGPEELWSAFKTTVLDVAGGCLGTHRRVEKNFLSQRTQDTIVQSHSARLHGRAELFRELWRKTVHALRVDKEAYV